MLTLTPGRGSRPWARGQESCSSRFCPARTPSVLSVMVQVSTGHSSGRCVCPQQIAQGWGLGTKLASHGGMAGDPRRLSGCLGA